MPERERGHNRPMSLMIELLASEHEADLHRETDERRLRRLVTACQRRIFGLLPGGQPCEPQPAT